MPHDVTLITTIAAGLGLALLTGLLATRAGLPPLVGYLVAGIVIGPATPGIRGGRRAHQPTRRARRDAHDVRGGAALLHRGPDVGAPHRRAGRHRADRRRHRTRRGDGAVVGMESRRGDRVRPVALRGEHGRAPARTGSARGVGVGQRQDRRRLAGGGGPGGRAGAGAAPRAGGSARRDGARGGRRRRSRTLGPAHARQGGGVRGADGARRPPVLPQGALGRRPHRLAGAVHPGGDLGRRRRRLPVGQAVQRVVRARRVLRGDDDARVGPEPPCRGGVAPAPRRIRGAVLRFRRHAVRPAYPATGAAQAALGRGDRAARQDGRRRGAGARISISAQHRADRRREPRADRRVLLHPRGPWV